MLALLALLLLFWSVGIFFAHTAVAATSATINFQARLMNSSGSIAPDGDYNVEFKLYDTASTGGTAQGACSGNCKWLETRTGVNKVHIANGYLTVSLGSVTAFGSTIKWDQDLWVTMNIGGTSTPSWDGEMSPRLKLTAVPYAFRAGQLASLSGANTAVLQFAGTINQDSTITLPDPGAGGTATVCYQSSTSCGFAAGTAASYIQNGTSVQTGANFAIRSNATGSVAGVIQGANGQTADLLDVQSWNGTSATTVFGVSNTGAGTFAGNLSVQGGTLTVGTAAQAGSLALYDANGQKATISVGDLAADRALAIPVATGSDTFCLQTLANCASGVTVIGTIDTPTTSADGAHISGTTLYMQTATASVPGLVSTSTQTFAGNKTFNGNILLGGSSPALNFTTTTTDAAINFSNPSSGVGHSLTVTGQTGAASSTGGLLTLQAGTGGNAAGGGNVVVQGGTAGSGNTNGGNVTLQGGTLAGSGVKGLIQLNGGTVFTTGSYSSGSTSTITQSLVDSNSAILASATAGSLTFTVPSPTTTTAGRVLYVSNNGSNPFTLAGAGTSFTLNTGSTATLVWSGSAWTSAGVDASTLQNVYNNSTGGTTAEVVLDATRVGFDIQDANTTTIGATQSLLTVRASTSAGNLGGSYFNVNASGKVGINLGSTSTTPTISNDLSFGQVAGASTARTIGVEAQGTSATGGNGLAITAGTGNTSGVGGTTTIQGGNGGNAAGGGTVLVQGGTAGGGNTNGGNVTLQGGTKAGTGVKGLIEINGGAFFTAVDYSSGSTSTITQSLVDSNAVIRASATAASLTFTIPSPTITTAGRILYITNNGSNAFTLAGAGTSFTLNVSSTATLVWNGTTWTSAGVDASTLQNVYINSTGGTTPEILANSTEGGIDIQDNSLTSGTVLLAVRATASASTLGTGLLTVDNTGATVHRMAANSTSALQLQNAAGLNVIKVDTTNSNLAVNGGAETAFGAEWALYGAGGSSIAQSTAQKHTGSNSALVHTTGGSGRGAINNLGAALTNGQTYALSVYVRVVSGAFTDFTIDYTYDGNSTHTNTCTQNTSTILTTGWTRVTCLLTVANAGTSSAAIELYEASGGTRDFYLDDLEVRNVSSVNPYTLGTIQLNGVISTDLALQNGENSTTAFQIFQAGADVLFTGDTTNNRLIVGNATGTDTATTLLVVDSATADPTTNVVNGGIFYNTTTNKFRCRENGAWGNCINGSTQTLQNVYTASTGGTTPEVLLDTTRNGVDIQDANTTIGSTQALLAVRASASATTLGNGLFVVNASGKVGINTGSTSTTPTLSYDLSFAGANRTIGVEANTANAAGFNLTLSAGAAGAGASAFSGGTLALQGGAAGGTGNAAGGAVTVTGGTGLGTSAGGTVTVSGGTGGGSNGAGGKLVLQGGSAGATNAAGGDTYVLGGTNSGTGTAGNTLLGVTTGNVAQGNVGVGTNAPTRPLHISVGNTLLGTPEMLLEQTNTAGDSSLEFKNTAAATSFYIGQDTSNTSFSIGSSSSSSTTPSTISHVQSTTTAPLGGATTISLAYGSNTTAGNLLVAVVAWDLAASSSVTCSDSSGSNVWSTAIIKLDPTAGGGNNDGLAVCYAPNVVGGADTVTATFGASSISRMLAIHEYSGVAKVNPIDVTVGNVNAGSSSTDGVTSTTATTSQNGDLVFGVTYNDTGSVTTITAGTGFTQRTLNSNFIMTEDKTQATAGSATTTNTYAAVRRYISVMATFKAVTNVVDTFAGSLFTLSQSGATTFKNSVDSSSAFQIQSSSATPLFLADAANSRIYIGNPTADSVGTVLVTDTSNSATEPTGVNGAIYYNAGGAGGASGSGGFQGKFRCYEGGLWKNCVGMRDIVERRWGYATQQGTSTLNFVGTGLFNSTILGAGASGTAAVSNQAESNYAIYPTAATSGNKGGLGNTFSATAMQTRWLPKLVTRVRVDGSAVSTARYWVGLASASLDAQDPTITAGALGTSYIGMSASSAVNSSKWICGSGDGTNHSGVDSGVTMTANHYYDIIVDLTTAGTLVCSISDNGGAFTTVTKTTNLPGTSTSLGLEETVTTTAAAARNLSVAYSYLEYQ